MLTPYSTPQTTEGLSTCAQNKLSLWGCPGLLPAVWPCFCYAGVRPSCQGSLIPWPQQALPTSDCTDPVEQSLDHLETINACQCGPQLTLVADALPGISTAISDLYSASLFLPEPPYLTSSDLSPLSPWLPLVRTLFLRVRNWDQQQASALVPGAASYSLCLP